MSVVSQRVAGAIVGNVKKGKVFVTYRYGSYRITVMERKLKFPFFAKFQVRLTELNQEVWSGWFDTVSNVENFISRFIEYLKYGGFKTHQDIRNWIDCPFGGV